MLVRVKPGESWFLKGPSQESLGLVTVPFAIAPRVRQTYPLGISLLTLFF